MANRTSQHILGTSSNLLGFCLIIMTSLHLTDRIENGYIDEFTAIIAILLTISTFCSFISIRTENLKLEYKLERIADILFGVSLLGICGTVLFIMINFWNIQK